MFSHQLFTEIDGKKGSGIQFEVKFSMLEIYNEIARDLLDPNGTKKKGGLKIRQHPKKGFYGELSSLSFLYRIFKIRVKVFFPMNEYLRK